MERSLNLFLLMTAFAQILALGFTLRIGRLVPGGEKRSAVINYCLDSAFSSRAL